MNILIIGSGGREHALAWKVSQSPRVRKIFVMPGNPGTAQVAENVTAVDEHAGLVSFCHAKEIDLVIIGPEGYLADGLADALAGAGIRCFGPRQAAAQIEASKVFAKDFMRRHNLPTARYATFREFEPAVRYLEELDYPIVIKASGLAAGKGVILPDTVAEAKSALQAILVDKAFGSAGDEVVIEERMSGPEVSLMAFTDGTCVVPMLPAQDHKRCFDGDQGPNTGGMGAYAPAPVFTADLMNEALETVLIPTINGLRNEGLPFVGVLYAGLMLTPTGMRVLEFNCRFGDPETQVVLPLLETDLLEIIEACVSGHLADVNLRWRNAAAVCVMLAGKGYPEKAESGKTVTISALPEDVLCFQAGTKMVDGKLVTSSGRVLGLTAVAGDIASAIETVYANVARVSFEGMHYRKDIGYRALSTAFTY